jgi:Retrotransposon gag protein
MAQAQPQAAPAGVNQDQIRNILAQHDRVRKSTDLPLFYGRKDKDTCTARMLLDRFETAARIANWNNDVPRKIEEFYLIMRDKALLWWKSLEDIPDFPKNANGQYNNWDRVKEEFLAAYAVKYTPKSACTNFQDLVQRTGETVQDFYLRVNEAYQRLRESRPEALFVVRYNVDPPVVADIKKEGIDDMGRFFLQQLFLAGLKEDIRIKTMEGGHTTVQASLTAARETEAILNDKAKRSMISAIRSEDDECENEEFENFFTNYLGNKDENDLEPWEEQFIHKINAMRFVKGKKPFKFPGKRFDKTQATCRYCSIKGHFQKECRKRLKDGKPMVDINGKPFNSNYKVSSLQDEEGDQDDEEPPSYSKSVSALSYYGINSIRRHHLN